MQMSLRKPRPSKEAVTAAETHPKMAALSSCSLSGSLELILSFTLLASYAADGLIKSHVTPLLSCFSTNLLISGLSESMTAPSVNRSPDSVFGSDDANEL